MKVANESLDDKLRDVGVQAEGSHYRILLPQNPGEDYLADMIDTTTRHANQASLLQDMSLEVQSGPQDQLYATVQRMYDTAREDEEARAGLDESPMWASIGAGLAAAGTAASLVYQVAPPGDWVQAAYTGITTLGAMIGVGFPTQNAVEAYQLQRSEPADRMHRYGHFLEALQPKPANSDIFVSADQRLVDTMYELTQNDTGMSYQEP